jgi:hypothetical protein
MRTKKILLVVSGAIVALVATVLVLGGVTLMAVHATARDSAGYYTSPTGRFQTSTFAVTTDRIDLGSGVREQDWGPLNRLGTARLSAVPLDARAVFVGIARQADVDRYLAGTARDQVRSIDFDPFRASYQRIDGGPPASPPVAQPIWAASAVGTGRQTLTWPIERGSWSVVLMNADASPGVAVDARAGIKTGLLLPLGAGLTALGLLFGALATVLLLVALRSRPAPGLVGTSAPGYGSGPAAAAGPSGTAAAGVSAPPPGSYPLRLRGRLDPDLNRGLWLVKWFLAIPHLVVLAFLWIAFSILSVVAGLVILVTGRYPRSIFDFNVGVLRWSWRVTFYAFALGTDRYPPFSLEADPSYPADLAVDRPKHLNQPLVLIKWWLLALPQLVIVSLIGGGIAWWTYDNGRGYTGPGLLGVLVLIAGVSLLVTRRYPQALFDLVVGLYRWIYRVIAYTSLMRDEYPPFRLDQGGDDPGDQPVAVWTPPIAQQRAAADAAAEPPVAPTGPVGPGTGG